MKLISPEVTDRQDAHQLAAKQTRWVAAQADLGDANRLAHIIFIHRQLGGLEIKRSRLVACTAVIVMIGQNQVIALSDLFQNRPYPQMAALSLLFGQQVIRGVAQQRVPKSVLLLPRPPAVGDALDELALLERQDSAVGARAVDFAAEELGEAAGGKALAKEAGGVSRPAQCDRAQTGQGDRGVWPGRAAADRKSRAASSGPPKVITA